ncbi:hypothetical protein [Nonomuraea sediminis]|uniref:hypothetical protein n=1 Tax=Nonomuraea sediminis TaxID=2835864 RepID=UPI001BDD422F|nr:hypothetical protein [Nonomuraea sediminis]
MTGATIRAFGTAAAMALVVALTGACGGGEPAALTAAATPAQVLGTRTGTAFDGEPVTATEVLRAAATIRAEVVSEFSRYGVPLGPGFWDKPHAGVTARERLRQRAVGQAVLDKARRIWAREEGLLSDVSEAGFQRELAAENRRRAEAAAAGRPLPGVPSYDEYTYAQVRAAELDAALSKRYAAHLDLSDRRLREQYRRMAGTDAPPFAEARENVRQALILEEYTRALQKRAGFDQVRGARTIVS